MLNFSIYAGNVLRFGCADSVANQRFVRRVAFVLTLTMLTDPLDRVFTYSYDGRSAVTALAMPSGNAERFRYRPDGLLSHDSVDTSLGLAIRAAAFTHPRPPPLASPH